MNKYKIAYGIYNQVDQINNDDIYLRAKGASLFYLERLNRELLYDNRSPITIICRDKIHTILQDAVDQQFDYCVVMSAGLLIKNFQFYKDLEEFIDTNNFGIAGHPLWKTDGSWLELHPQFFIVNLEAYKNVGCPEFGDWSRENHMLPILERSEENFHDDYTPLWVKATGKHSMQLIACQGWKLLSAMFDGEYDVITLTEKIRLSKFYTYPDHETTKFAESLRTLTTYPDMNWNQNKWINDSKCVKDQIWLFNSESIRIHNNNGPYDLVVNTASGFKIFDFFKTPRLSDNAKCIVYDFNPKSLEWYKHFYNWPNENLLDCIRAFPDKDNFTWIGQYDPTYNENVGFYNGLKETFEYFINEETFQLYWKQFKSMPVDFVEIDLYNNQTKLAMLMHGDGRKWINLTNIFSTDATQVIFGHAECMAAQARCLGLLYTVDPTIDVTMFDFWNRNKVGCVRDII